MPHPTDSWVCYTAKLTPGPVDIDGDGVADIKFASVHQNTGYIDRIASYGLVGNIGGGPGGDAVWARETSTVVASDGEDRNEKIVYHRGALLSSDDNWSKARLSSGDGWVQWAIGDKPSVIWPVAFVRENPGENLSASQAAARR